ncbi:helix-turn-helix domain-containing protein [Streptomyces sp. NPDC001980]|uniref:helix-turn-helix domain-containing protein n=1 Tax=Streptomyces sp. NPDC001980 TaxID=3157126 RepID=UPI003333DC23
MRSEVPQNPANPSGDYGHATNYASIMNLTPRQIHESVRPFAEWEGGPFAHLTGLEIPRPNAAHGFNFSASGHLFDDLLSAEVYCDSLTGISGRGEGQDPIVADLVTAGSLRFSGKAGESIVGPGQICIRDTNMPWKFSCAPGTRIRVVTIPRPLLVSRIGSAKVFNYAYVADAKTPEVRFLTNFLEVVERSSADLDRSTSTRNLALSACTTLFSEILSQHPEATLSDYPQTTLEVARNVIEKNLERGDLSPVVIAHMAGVSLRTLQRSFAESNDSIMAFVRRNRLQRAHDDLIRLGSAARVSEIAARWHFSDASHFIRTFKSVYGASPAAYLRTYGNPGAEAQVSMHHKGGAPARA